MIQHLVQRLQRLHREALGLNRRNHDYMIPFNPPQLVALVDNKLATKRALEERRLPVARTYAACAHFSQLRDLGERLRQFDDFVLKPARGAGGEGIVVVVQREQEQWLRPSGKRVSEQDLLAHAADILAGAFSLTQTTDEVFVEHRLQCHPDFEAFCVAGVPDVRIVVVHGVPILAMVRLPTRQSDGRANLHLGGIGVGVDFSSGCARHAVWEGRAIEQHPDTGAPLRELRVPCWGELLDISARCFDAVPLGYLGVDIVIDPHLGPCILELNARPGLAIQLANGKGLRPLLEALGGKHADPARTAAERVELGLSLHRSAG